MASILSRPQCVKEMIPFQPHIASLIPVRSWPVLENIHQGAVLNTFSSAVGQGLVVVECLEGECQTEFDLNVLQKAMPAKTFSVFLKKKQVWKHLWHSENWMYVQEIYKFTCCCVQFSCVLEQLGCIGGTLKPCFTVYCLLCTVMLNTRQLFI